MACPAAVPDAEPTPPSADPHAIRSCLSPSLAAEFDREWEIVLDQVKKSQDLGEIFELLNKWQHTAYMEMRDPGSYYRLLARAEQIHRAGGNPDAVSDDEMMERINKRLGR